MIFDLLGKFVEVFGESVISCKVSFEQNSNFEEVMEVLLVLGYKVIELKKVKVFFEGMNEIVE